MISAPSINEIFINCLQLIKVAENEYDSEKLAKLVECFGGRLDSEFAWIPNLDPSVGWHICFLKKCTHKFHRTPAEALGMTQQECDEVTFK